MRRDLRLEVLERRAVPVHAAVDVPVQCDQIAETKYDDLLQRRLTLARIVFDSMPEGEMRVQPGVSAPNHLAHLDAYFWANGPAIVPAWQYFVSSNYDIATVTNIITASKDILMGKAKVDWKNPDSRIAGYVAL